MPLLPTKLSFVLRCKTILLIYSCARYHYFLFFLRRFHPDLVYYVYFLVFNVAELFRFFGRGCYEFFDEVLYDRVMLTNKRHII